MNGKKIIDGLEDVSANLVYLSKVTIQDRLDEQGGWIPAVFLNEVGQEIKGKFYLKDGLYVNGVLVGTMTKLSEYKECEDKF